MWYIYNDEEFPENKFVKLEDIEYDSHMDVLQGYEVCDVNLFIEELRKLGFEHFVYSKSLEKLYPFIEV